VEGCGNQQQPAAQHVKKHPGEEQARYDLPKLNDAVQTVPAMDLRLCEPFEAGRTQDAVFMLCDAFPAVEAAALRAPRNGFAHRMVEATLFREDRHKSGSD